MISMTTFAFLGFLFYAFISAMLLLITWSFKLDKDKVIKDLSVFIEAKDWNRALLYINDQVGIKKYLKPMFENAQYPHRILLTYEESLSSLHMSMKNDFKKAFSWANRIYALVYIFALTYLLYMSNPTGWMQVWLAGWICMSFFIQARVQKFMGMLTETEDVLITLRNRMYLAHDYIPPEYRARAVDSVQLEMWRKSQGEIERAVIAGTPIEEATNEQIRKIQERYDHVITHPKDPPPPNSRLELLSQGQEE